MLGQLDSDEIQDVIVNCLACICSSDSITIEHTQQLLKKFEGLEKSYEFYFNLSQVYLKNDKSDLAIKFLREAHDLAVKED